MTKIYTVNALCGSGKTYAAIRYAIKRAKFGEKIAIIQPSKDLIKQSYDNCVAMAGSQSVNIDVKRIDSDTCGSGEVKKHIISHLRSGEESGEVLFITHAAFLSMPYWHNAQAWTILFDELPVVDRDFTKNVPATHSIVTDHISALSNDPVYYTLTASDPAALRVIAENRERDDVYEVFRDVADALVTIGTSMRARKTGTA